MKIVLFCCSWAIVVQSALADGNAQFLDDINQYRLSQSLPEFKANSGAACVAQQVAEQYKGTPCSNSTGTATVSGQEPQLDESLLSKCNLQLVNVKDGFMGPTCVPAGTSAANAPKLAANNVTMSPVYTEYVNDTKFVSAGAGSVDNAWFVLVLATNASGGNYVNQDLDPSSHAFALRAGLGPISVLAYLVSTFILA
jgi:hypothetical protein